MSSVKTVEIKIKVTVPDEWDDDTAVKKLREEFIYTLDRKTINYNGKTYEPKK